MLMAKRSKSIKETVFFCLLLLPGLSYAGEAPPSLLTREGIQQALGWQQTGKTQCGGYYWEPAIASLENKAHPDTIEITSNQMLYAFHGTSESQGKTIIRRFGQEITGNKAYLYRDPNTGKLSAIDLFGHVTLREPNTLVLAKQAHFDFQTKAPSLFDVLYRTAIYSEAKPKPELIPIEQATHTQKIYQLSAWGKSNTFNQAKPKVYTLDDASYTTCPPTQSLWSVKTSHLILNKETGRGTATHARLLIKEVPVFYMPYINFPIDHRRQTGFLWPTFGSSSKSGYFFKAPFYWNIAPNYDMSITPSLLSTRGVQIIDHVRYLTPSSEGYFKIAILPNDKAFGTLQETSEETYGSSSNSTTQAKLRRLLNASTTRKSLIWKNESRFNEHWSSTVDYSYVSDDNYLRDLSTGVNEVTQNQLLQQADVTYKGKIWNFIGRVQSYETLHPLNMANSTDNAYNRYPQLVLNGLYPQEKTGLEYFINNEFTHFTILNNPGSFNKKPMGNRINTQPGISRPINLPYFYLTPRVQFALTKYQLGDTENQQPNLPSRSLPIFDIGSGLYFDRDVALFSHTFTQTLEPQIFYTYIPFHNQNDLPIFDTSLNQLTFDQLFMYNRFSGIDRIGDANQISTGVTTRFIDQQSGYEKIRAGVGQILYFKNRRVTLCATENCNDNPEPDFNKRNRSPISGVIRYSLNPIWSLQSDTIWDPLMKKQKLTNEMLGLHYQTDSYHILNLVYTFAQGGDRYPHDTGDKSSNNLSQTDISGVWPVTHEWSGVARWTQNLNRHNFQNLLFGVQYDTCCWAIRLVAGKEFIGLGENNTALYNPEVFVQFALKGLGNFGTGDPTQMLKNSVSGYQTQFGQDY